MAKLIVTKPWPAPRGVLAPGTYDIPHDIIMTHAKCCRADGCGEISGGEAAKDGEPFRKTGAPENKARGRAPRRRA
jgi:hypothetical protein